MTSAWKVPTGSYSPAPWTGSSRARRSTGTGRPCAARGRTTSCTSATGRPAPCSRSARRTRCSAAAATSRLRWLRASASGATGCCARALASATAWRATATPSSRSSTPRATRGGWRARTASPRSCSERTWRRPPASQTTPSRSTRASRAASASCWTCGSAHRWQRSRSSSWAALARDWRQRPGRLPGPQSRPRARSCSIADSQESARLACSMAQSHCQPSSTLPSSSARSQDRAKFRPWARPSPATASPKAQPP
mmetsp:Transcript_91544/g.284640  ORF Transcript_91544/g.284640 Transcript_91544/m.284640 type:complete len:254 (+) Transcript_91544:628-1389(+)